ncbi:MAG: YjjG family noncanonical pyrimidine nucleotidase [Allomuricauda sp.]
MFKNHITDIFFDLDHTLWDFERNSALTFEKILGRNKIDVNLDSFLKVYVPINLDYWKLYREDRITKDELRYQRLKKTFDALGAQVSDEHIHLLAHEYIQHLSTFTHLFPGTVEVLEYLSPKYNLHIITNGFQEIQEKKLKGANIDRYFEHVINSEEAGVKKPHPQIFHMALDRAKVSAENSLMVGDSLEADIQGAIAVGFQTLHFNAHNEVHHKICPMINNLSEIKGIL